MSVPVSRGMRVLAASMFGMLTAFALAGCVSVPLSTSDAAAASSGIDGESVLKTTEWSQLAIGDCTGLTVDSEPTPSASVLDCSLPHGSEVFSTFTFPDNAPPSSYVHDDWADTTCRTAFDAGVPRSLTYITSGPSDGAWKHGERAGICLAVDPDGAALTEPLNSMPDDWTATPSYPASSSDAYLASVVPIIAIAIIAISLLVGIVLYVVYAVSLTLLFRKVGVPAWKAWVPFVQTWTLLRLGGLSGHWVWLAFVPYGSIVTAVFLYIAMYRIGLTFNKTAGTLVLGILLPFVWAFALAGRNDVYRPDVLAYRGFPPPAEGFGAVPRSG